MAKAKSTNMAFIPDETIVRKIYVVREQKIMLDFDLAMLYQVETRALNQSVKRNIDRFPKDFMFRLTIKEWLTMRSQIVIASSQPGDIQDNETIGSQIVTASQKKRNTAITPYAFTEHGVTMLASVLKS